MEAAAEKIRGGGEGKSILDTSKEKEKEVRKKKIYETRAKGEID